MRKIVIIGPVYPYKGGIAHYTTMLYRALKDKYEVTIVSFRMQYPRLLFRKEQKDYENDSFQIEGVNYWIHTANPVNWAVSAARIDKLEPDLILCEWWHPYFAPCFTALAMLLCRRRWLFLCHNVLPHERFPMDRLLTGMALKRGSCYIVQSGEDAQKLRQMIPEAVIEQAVHPTYNAFRFEGMTKQEARGLIGLPQEGKILLFFGFVREYKGLAYLFRALPAIKAVLEGVRLLVAGDFPGGGGKKRVCTTGGKAGYRGTGYNPGRLSARQGSGEIFCGVRPGSPALYQRYAERHRADCLWV